MLPGEIFATPHVDVIVDLDVNENPPRPITSSAALITSSSTTIVPRQPKRGRRLAQMTAGLYMLPGEIFATPHVDVIVDLDVNENPPRPITSTAALITSTFTKIFARQPEHGRRLTEMGPR